jgi:hypothetical protein
MKRLLLILLVLAVLALLVLVRDPDPRAPLSGPAVESGSPAPEPLRAPTPLAPRENLVLPSNAAGGLEGLLMLARSNPERLDLARGTMDLEFLLTLREAALASGLDAGALMERLGSLELEDGARPALVLALAWCPDPEGIAERALLGFAGLPGRRTNTEEQCALAAVRALGLSGRSQALRAWVDARLQPQSAAEEGLQPLRTWIALQELDSAPESAAALLLGEEDPAHLPERVQEELMAAAARSGDPLWSEEILAQAADGRAIALAGLAALRDPARETELLALHSRAQGWTRLAAQKALLGMSTPGTLAALQADLADHERRDGALEALRTCAPRDDAVVQRLRESLQADEEASSALANAWQRVCWRRQLR